jgi:hypothetical protein
MGKLDEVFEWNWKKFLIEVEMEETIYLCCCSFDSWLEREEEINIWGWMKK